MCIEINFIGIDDWGRRVYQNTKNKKRFYKTYEEKATRDNLYTSDSFYGEPDCPLKKDIRIKVVDPT